ncbi:MAG: response regulator [Planctomycetaceae bacterium]
MAEPKTILVVDDEPGMRKSLTAVFANEGYHVVSARSGDEALDRCRNGGVNVVLLDLRLTGNGNGLDALRRLRALHPNIPVLVMTADTDDATRRAADDCGAAAFFTKPLDLDQVIQSIESVT